MWFNLCYHGACRRKALYITKDGYGYCFKHTVLLLDDFGIELFWPHYHGQIYSDLERDKNVRKIRAEKRLQDMIDGDNIDVVVI